MELKNKAWDETDALKRIAGEGVRQNQALRDFADLGPVRKIRRLYLQYQTDIKKGLTPPSINERVLYRWSSKFCWAQRILDHSTVAQVEASARQVAHFESYTSKKLTILESIASRVEEMLKFPVSKKETKANGQVIIVHPARWDYGTVGNLLRILNEIENLDNGKPTAHLKIDDIDNMTDEQLREYLSKRIRNRTEATGESLAGSGTPGDEPAGDSESDPSSGTIH